MARKPNYKFDRMERDRAKAARKAERAKIKAERTEARQTGEDGAELPDDEIAPDTAGLGVDTPPERE